MRCYHCYGKFFRYPAAYAQIRNIVSKKVFFGSASDMECMGACDNALIWLSDFHMTCCLSSPVTTYMDVCIGILS